jgi:biopolymer transport protein ExbD
MPNLAPILDISLLLIVVFLAVAPLFARELPLKLPRVEAKAAENGLPAGQVVVRAMPDGLTVNGVQVTDDKLLEALRTALAGEEAVILDASPELRYDRVVFLLDVFRQAGARSVGLAPDLAPVLNPAAPAGDASSTTANTTANPTEVAP